MPRIGQGSIYGARVETGLVTCKTSALPAAVLLTDPVTVLITKGTWLRGIV